MFRAVRVLALSLVLATTACRTTSPTAGVPAYVPATATVAVIAAPPQDWRAYVGRRVRIDAPLTISGNYGLARDGELIASFGGRLFAPTEIAAPGADAARVAADNAHRRLTLAVPAEAMAAAWRSGGVLDGLEGVVEAHDGDLRVQVDAPLRVRPGERPPPPAIAGDVRLASLNLENLFNGDGRGAGFPTARGARTAAEYERQLGKLVATVKALAPDIVALTELENDGYGPESSLAQLVAALNTQDSDGDWRHVDAGSGPGSDPIRVGLIYRADRLAAVGKPVTLVGGPFGDLSRVPLAQAFRAGTGPVFTVVAVHFKSKGCSEAEKADRDQQDGQACWNATRTGSAHRLDQWLKQEMTRSGSDLAVILGDFNAYAREDPMRALAATGWQDALTPALSMAPIRYTYVYDAQAGRLDHALLSPALAGRLKGAAIWHSNADEAANVGYRDGNSAEIGHTPWRSSDHDPILIGLDLRTP